jgi:hypothetical protein
MPRQLRVEYPGAKSDSIKLSLAGRLRRETTLTLREISEQGPPRAALSAAGREKSNLSVIR